MEKINVHLLVGNLPLYNELLKNPPEGVRYTSKPLNKMSYYSKKTLLKRKLALFLVRLFKIPRMGYIKTDADLIHSNRGICILNRKPWVMDIDHASSFVGFDHKIWRERIYRKLVERFLASNYCKKIMPWSIAAMKSLLNSFPNNAEIARKMEVVYPAVPPFRKKIKKGDIITLLFVASLFEEKGGLEVLKAFEILRKKYDVRLIVKADVPNDVKRKYNFPEIKYYPYKTQILSREELLEKFFAKADIFVYPTYFDIFGLGVLDALAVGIPVVTTDTFALPEIVENNKNGLLIKSPIKWHDETFLWNPKVGSEKDKKFIVNSLVEKISLLIENSSLRKRMGGEGKILVEKGKFSIIERNKKLKRIYEEALKY